MASLDELVTYLDNQLQTRMIADYPGAMNGLQLANNGRIDRVIAAVDASLSVIEAAAEGGSGLLIVHHGMFWQGPQPVTGALYRKLKIAMQANLAIYSSHLPLDVHPVLGNNILLAQAIGMREPQPFLENKCVSLGLRGTWNGTRQKLIEVLQVVLGGPVHFSPGGPERISSLAIITGGAGGEVARVAASGVDTFITGEGPHWSYVLAEESGVNLLYCGHYATETLGVRAVSECVCRDFKIPWTFIDRPTGL